MLPIQFYCWCKFPQELNDDDLQVAFLLVRSEYKWKYKNK